MYGHHVSERQCNWCGPSALADSDPGPGALCIRHQAAYYERRAADEQAQDEAWWSEMMVRELAEAEHDGSTLALLS